MSSILEVNNLGVKLGGRTILEGLSFSLQQGEILAITGRTGTGKTTLLKALLGKIFHSGEIKFSTTHPNIVLIGRQHRFHNLSNTSTFYYQQRFNSSDAEDSNTVLQELLSIDADENKIRSISHQLNIQHILESNLIQLSNGEHKRFQIAKALLKNAEWILLDNPYTGLDVASRKMLDDILISLSKIGIHLILVTGSSKIPNFITRIIDLGTRESHHQILNDALLINIPAAYDYQDFHYAVKMINTTISYGNKKILDNINWEVKKGECWNLRGHNGSGKSTLLSLINGDNPQAFANEIYLFDKRKGTGESIWDIKKMTGYISPELHHYFDSSSNAFDIVASGLFDTIGLFRNLSSIQKIITQQWMKVLDIEHLTGRLFTTLSDGEQRMVLLARALVKNPPLLILDEPCQGLDEDTTQYFVQIIDQVCKALGKTLIYVSHLDEEIPSVVDKRIELVAGRIIS